MEVHIYPLYKLISGLEFTDMDNFMGLSNTLEIIFGAGIVLSRSHVLARVFCADPIAGPIRALLRFCDDLD